MTGKLVKAPVGWRFARAGTVSEVERMSRTGVALSASMRAKGPYSTDDQRLEDNLIKAAHKLIAARRAYRRSLGHGNLRVSIRLRMQEALAAIRLEKASRRLEGLL